MSSNHCAWCLIRVAILLGAINQSLANVTLQTFELSAMKNGINKLDLPIVIFLAGMLSVLFQIRNFMITTTFVTTKITQTLFSDI